MWGINLPRGQADEPSFLYEDDKPWHWPLLCLLKLSQRGAMACQPVPLPAACRWGVLPGEMASKRGGHACVAAGGCLYALGGFDSLQAIPHCEVFDPRVSRACGCLK